MIAYKVLRRVVGELFSWNANIPSEFRQRYKQGEENRPKVGKLFVFKYESDARYFKNLSRGGNDIYLELWSVEVPDLEEIKKIAHWLSGGNDYRGLWEGKTIYESSLAVPGSYVASSVKLLEMIV